MYRFLIALLIVVLTPQLALAGFDETINSLTAPIASLIGQIVFFKISLFGAKLPLVVLWLVVGIVVTGLFGC